MTSFMDLLQAEYIKLQQNYIDLQKRYDLLATAAGDNRTCNGDNSSSNFSFEQKLMEKISEIYNKDLYSDITVHCDGHQLRGHRLVISTRTDYWGDLSGADHIELKDIPYNVGCAILKWMYTDHLDNQLGNRYLMGIFAAASKFRLFDLQERCESFLRERIDQTNCLSLFEFALKNDLVQLRDSCGEMVKARWNDFDTADFASMPASLLYDLIKCYCDHVLHSVIRLRRSDVLFLYFVEHNSELPKLCNEEVDDTFPLELALELGETAMATSLIDHSADVNIIDGNGRTLLIRLMAKHEIDALIFLTQNGAKFDHKIEKTGENLLHIAASTKCSAALIEWLSSNLDQFDINDADCNSKTPLIRAIESENADMIELLLQKSETDVNKIDKEGRSPIALALFEFKDMALAEMIVKAGADLNAPYKDTFMIHYAVGTGNLDIILFLCKHKVDVNKRTAEGLIPLQVAVDHENYNADLIRILLRAGANFSQKISNTSDTLLHHILGKENDSEILEDFVENGNWNYDMLKAVDANGDTPFAKAVSTGKFKSAELLIKVGAYVDEKDSNGSPLLMRLINRKLDDAAAFLLEHGAGISGGISMKDCFSLAVDFSLVKTVHRLCNITERCDKRAEATILWSALKKSSFDVAKALIESGHDPNGWSYNVRRKCRQTLLHKAIDLGMRDAALFLIDSGCDIDASERRKLNDEQSSRDTPLFASIRSNFDDVSLCLIRRGAKLDVQDADGQTVVHLAVRLQNVAILKELLDNCNPSLLLEIDHVGNTPLDIAIELNDHVIAKVLVEKSPNLISQVDSNGEMQLHKTVRAADLEWVLFFIAAKANVNAFTENALRLTPLHLSAYCGSEIIMRNLILAGANVNANAADGITPLHVAAANNHEALCMILLENGAEPNAADFLGDTPLHAAASHGSVASVNVLISDSRINLRALNKKQQNPLFLTAGDLSRTNSLDILQMFLNADPQYPVDERDVDGFTVFLSAYLKGNENMCRALLRYGVCLGVVSRAGISVFKHETPTKQLLFSLLDKLEREPSWAEGDSCSECEVKFSLTMRKHHCRHCGRLVCARCSEQTMPILKYGIEKSVRVCQICCDILTMGHV